MTIKREVTFDIARGIAIILVVWGHMGGVGNTFYYSFHVMCFFILAGLTDHFTEISRIKRSIYSMLISYIVYSLIFLLYDLVVRIGILKHDISWLIISGIQFITLDGIAVMWFLPTLMFSYFWALFFLKKVNKKVWLIVASFVMAWSGNMLGNYIISMLDVIIINKYVITFLKGIVCSIFRPFVGTFFIIEGVLLREYYIKFKEKLYIGYLIWGGILSDNNMVFIKV